MSSPESEIPSSKSPSLCALIVKVEVSPAATAGMTINPFGFGRTRHITRR